MARSKKCVREWFVGELRNGVLTPKRGCTRVVVRVGADIDETSHREPHRVLTANIGDRLILCGANVDQLQSAEVRRVEIDGWSSRLHLSLGYGAVNDGTVHILKAGKAA